MNIVSSQKDNLNILFKIFNYTKFNKITLSLLFFHEDYKKGINFLNLDTL
jgi:hypothetical protein